MSLQVSMGTNEHAVPLSTTACQASISIAHGTGAAVGALGVGARDGRAVLSTQTPLSREQWVICAQKLVETKEQLTPLSTTAVQVAISSSLNICTNRSTSVCRSEQEVHVVCSASTSDSAVSTRPLRDSISVAHWSLAAAVAAATLAAHDSMHPSSVTQSHTQMYGHTVGSVVGLDVGLEVGLVVGVEVGEVVGGSESVGDGVGGVVGDVLGSEVGLVDGGLVGVIVGETDGIGEGLGVGTTVGETVGSTDGVFEGVREGIGLGTTVGDTVGKQVLQGGKFTVVVPHERAACSSAVK